MSIRTSRRLWRTAAATFIAAALALPLSMVPASAAPVVDSSKTGSITVHKFQRPSAPTGIPNNGTEVATPGLTPMDGIEFSIQQVNTIDLASNAGWTKASALSKVFSPANPSGSITAAGYTLGAAKKQVTAGGGLATFATLPLGVYLVTETGYGAGVTPSVPFLVTVPLTDPNNLNTWLYDVHVYPKNSVTTATKTVQDASAAKLGDALSFTINAGIPTDAVIDGYKIEDKLDAKLTYTNAVVTMVDGTTLTLTTDYTITHDTASNTVTVLFTDAGRAILAKHNTTQVKVVINAKANAIGEISNTANVYPNANSFTIAPGQPMGPVVTPPILTKWGSKTVQKKDDKNAALPGASFSVFITEADAKAGTNPVTLGGQTVFTVDAAGKLVISGLRYSDWANGAAVTSTDAGFITYYLVETTAPKGFELLAQPIAFTVTAATTAGTDVLDVINVPHNGGFELPLTGGPGTTLLYAGGLLLLAGATILFIRNRRASSKS